MTPLLTTDMPVKGAAYDRSRPETREPWNGFRTAKDGPPE